MVRLNKINIITIIQRAWQALERRGGYAQRTGIRRAAHRYRRCGLEAFRTLLNTGLACIETKSLL